MASIRNEALPSYTNSAGPTVNPTAAGSVLADTGAMTGGLYELRVCVGSTVAAVFNLSRRNAANGADVGSVIVLRGAAGQTGEYIFKYDIAPSERLRVMPQADITGTAEATVNAVRVV